jgi:O-antigen/teichoic acid export membrane protein
VSRVRQLVASVSASYVCFAVTSGCSLVAVPIYLHFLMTEQYGLWLTILSVLMPLSLTSLGFPTASHNMLAEARARSDWHTVNRVLSTSFIFLCFAAVVACLVLALGLRLGIVQGFLRTSSATGSAIVPALLVALAGFAISQPLQVFRLGFRAFERVDLEQYGLAALSVVNLLLTVLALWAGWGIAGVAAVYAFLQFPSSRLRTRWVI